MSRRGGSDVMYDGKQLAAYLDARLDKPHKELTDTLARALHRWRTGERASEQSVDNLCCFLGWGSHITAIPHELIVKGRHLIDPDFAPPGLEGLEWDGKGAWVRKKAA